MCHPQVWGSVHGLSRCHRGLLPLEAENTPLDTLPLSFSASSAQSLGLGDCSIPLNFLHPAVSQPLAWWPFSGMRLDGAMWKLARRVWRNRKEQIQKEIRLLIRKSFFSSLCSVPYYAERGFGSHSDEFHTKLSILLLYYWFLQAPGTEGTGKKIHMITDICTALGTFPSSSLSVVDTQEVYVELNLKLLSCVSL